MTWVSKLAPEHWFPLEPPLTTSPDTDPLWIPGSPTGHWRLDLREGGLIVPGGWNALEPWASQYHWTKLRLVIDRGALPEPLAIRVRLVNSSSEALVYQVADWLEIGQPVVTLEYDFDAAVMAQDQVIDELRLFFEAGTAPFDVLAIDLWTDDEIVDTPRICFWDRLVGVTQVCDALPPEPPAASGYFFVGGLAPTSPPYFRVLRSPDGVVWTAATGLESMLGDENTIYGFLKIPGGNYVLWSWVKGLIATSADGLAWTEQPSGFYQGSTAIGIKDMAYGAGVLLAGGNDFILNSSQTVPRLIASADGGETWDVVTNHGLGAGEHFNSGVKGLAFGSGAFVLAGVTTANEPGFARSLDGLNWSTVTPDFGNVVVRGVSSIEGPTPVIRYGNGRFLTMVYSPSVSRFVVSTSLDGQSWEMGEPVGDGYFPARLHVANGEFFVMNVNNGVYYSSADGLAWTELAGPTSNIHSIAHNGSLYLVVPEIFTGPDLATLEPYFGDDMTNIAAAFYG